MSIIKVLEMPRCAKDIIPHPLCLDQHRSGGVASRSRFSSGRFGTRWLRRLQESSADARAIAQPLCALGLHGQNAVAFVGAGSIGASGALPYAFLLHCLLESALVVAKQKSTSAVSRRSRHLKTSLQLSCHCCFVIARICSPSSGSPVACECLEQTGRCRYSSC